ncbi:MAG: ABC transporter permease [Cyanobacteria bacterium SZAS LIN-3]|nr:ABC transporter permease [Cyanobacteria bacterium SZAS LIN-3]
MKNNAGAFATFAIIFTKELKHAFRDKDVLIYTFVVPAVIYPMLLICGMEMFIMKQESDSKDHSFYAVAADASRGFQVKAVDDLLARSKRFVKVESKDPEKDLFEGRIDFFLDEAAAAQSGESEVQAVVPRGMFATRLVGDLNEEIAGKYQAALNQAFKEKGLGEAAIQVNTIRQKNLNSDKGGIFSMGVALLFFSLLTVALGAAYPAIAATSEEFERNTIEPCLVLPVNHWFIVFAKLMAVVTLATLAGSLNVLSMGSDSSLVLMGAESVKGAEMLRLNLKMSAGQIPLVVLSYFSVSILYASLLLLSAAFCRTVRSSQQWISVPLTTFMLVPVLALVPSVELTRTTAWIPILNNLLVLRSLFNNDAFTWLHLISFIETIIIVAVVTKIVSILVFERFEDTWRFW